MKELKKEKQLSTSSYTLKLAVFEVVIFLGKHFYLIVIFYVKNYSLLLIKIDYVHTNGKIHCMILVQNTDYKHLEQWLPTGGPRRGPSGLEGWRPLI